MEQKKRTIRISTLRTKVSQIIDGKLKLIPLPWPILEHITQALLPGTITLFCGAPGSAKSLMLCQMLMYWHERDIQACAYMVEESLDFHLMRVLAQHVEQSGLTE